MAAAATILSFVLAFWGPPASQPPAHPAAAPTFPPHGGAFISSLPGSASAWVDGTFVGATPLYVDDLLPGHHAVTLSSAGWQPQSADFDVSVGRITAVSVVMVRSSSSPALKGQGVLTVVGAPAGSRVYVDGAPLGTSPVDPHPETAGYHIVTVQPPGKNAVRLTRIVDVFPSSTTSVAFSEQTASAMPPPQDDILEPVDSVVPLSGVVIAGSDVTIHYRGFEIECAIGSRAYTFNGKAGTLSISPALVGGKVYVPASLLARLSGK